MTKKYKVLVCGTSFGQVYLSAFLSRQPHFKLAGILGTGSDRSKQYAKEFGVPFYRKIEEVPDSVDIACIVVRATIAGGEGTYLAERFLKRKINVIQEHPVHERDILNCLELARINGVFYNVNSHYAHVDPILGFIDCLAEIRQQQKIRFVDASSSLQTAFSLVDIIGRCLGEIDSFDMDESLPGNITTAKGVVNYPFTTIQGAINQTPFTLKIQNYFDADDFDNHFLIMHRISIGTERGNLTLVNTHGPVIWSQSFSISREGADELAFHRRKTAFLNYSTPTAVSLTNDPAPSLREIAVKNWSPAITRALMLLKQQIETKITPFEQSKEYLSGLSRFWLAITRKIDPLQTLTLTPCGDLFPEPILARAESQNG